MILLIVESPAKAKTINKYLGTGYKVLASMGHVRDLPAKSGSIKPDNDFEMVWKTNSSRSKTIQDIKKEIQNSDKVILATDPDREGEAISWHLEELFKNKNDKKFERVVFNAVTKDTVLKAIKNPRTIDKDLVEAYKARLSLDYLIGFTISPVLWKKLPGAKSAGRVQSVALKIICQREFEVENFKSQKYWTINSIFKSKKGSEFSANLISIDNKKLNKFDIKSEEEALKIIKDLNNCEYVVKEISKTTVQKKPQPPFTTSTMQQEASKRLRFDPTRTMQVAQRLYEGIDNPSIEGGLITYMRTDGVQIEDSTIDQIRDSIKTLYGEKQLPKSKNIYKTKSKNAQESHEAIRPTSFKNTPEKIKSYLSEEQFKLYDLIWKRTIASQMNNAEFDRTSIDISVKNSNNIENLFRATTQYRSFSGYLLVFDDTVNEKEDNPVSSDDENKNENNILVTKDEKLLCKKLEDTSHQTEPPPRFNAASLIKTLEELGIGRPSTYASILSKLSERNYTSLDQRRISPTSNGRLVTAFLENYYPDYVKYDFTADLEEKLDQISNGDYTRLSLLNNFWTNLDESTKDITEISRKEVVEKLNETLAPYIFDQELDEPRKCPECGNGTLTLLSFKEGSFIGCSNYPTCKFQRDLSGKNTKSNSKQIITKDPKSGMDITLQVGRYGPYLELDDTDPDKKPKRVSVPKNIDLDNISEELAINLISLPRLVGIHPNTNNEIIGALGRYGPYIKHQNTYANLKEMDELYTIGLNRAITLIDEKDKKNPKANNQSIGKHPKSNDEIIAAQGKYGPYIKYQKKNYSIPKDISIDNIDIDKALEIISLKNKKNK